MSEETTKTNGEATGTDDRDATLLRFNRKRVLIVLVTVCVGIELLLVFLDATVNYMHWSGAPQIRRLVNMTREDALGSLVAVIQTFMAALTLWLIYIVSKRGDCRRKVVIGWLVLAILFSYMAFDDGAGFHERMGSVFKRTYTGETATADPGSLGAKLLRFFPSYPWQILFLPMFGAIGLYILYFLMKHLRERRAKFWTLVALSLFAGAVGLDFVEGLDENHPLNLYTRIASILDLDAATNAMFNETPYVTLRHFSKSIEEFMEMLGNTLLWAVFLNHLMTMNRKLHIEFVDPPAVSD